MNNQSQNETVSLILLTIVALGIGSGITCHLMRKNYAKQQQQQEVRVIPQVSVDDILVKLDERDRKREMERLNKERDEKIVKLTNEISESKKSAENTSSELALKYDDLKKTIDSLGSKNSVSKESFSVNRDLRNQVEFQNQTIIQLQKQVADLSIKNKETLTNSWVNDQKLNEIMILLKQKSQSCSQNKETESIQSQAKEKNKEASSSVVKQSDSPVIYKGERLSVKANLGSDYESPKVKYKNDELK